MPILHGVLLDIRRTERQWKITLSPCVIHYHLMPRGHATQNNLKYLQVTPVLHSGTCALSLHCTIILVPLAVIT